MNRKTNWFEMMVTFYYKQMYFLWRKSSLYSYRQYVVMLNQYGNILSATWQQCWCQVIPNTMDRSMNGLIPMHSLKVEHIFATYTNIKQLQSILLSSNLYKSRFLGAVLCKVTPRLKFYLGIFTLKLLTSCQDISWVE